MTITIRKTRKGTTIHFRGASARAAFEGMTGTKLPEAQPAPDWCDTMNRPKAQCRCPDCGPCLVDFKGE